MQRGEIRNPVTVLVLSILTCGFYAIYWWFAVLTDINRGLGRQEFQPLKELGLTLVTCGLWGIWLQWRMCEAIVEVQRAWGVEPRFEAVVLFLFGLLGVGPLFIQLSLNEAWEHGTPGGAGYGGPPPVV